MKRNATPKVAGYTSLAILVKEANQANGHTYTGSYRGLRYDAIVSRAEISTLRKVFGKGFIHLVQDKDVAKVKRVFAEHDAKLRAKKEPAKNSEQLAFPTVSEPAHAPTPKAIEHLREEVRTTVQTAIMPMLDLIMRQAALIEHQNNHLKAIESRLSAAVC